MSFADPTHPNIPDYLLFLRSQGFAAVDLPDNSLWVQTSFNVAKASTLIELDLANPTIYVLAIYNLGADRVVNFAIDQPNRSFFTALREQLRILSFAPGVVTSSSDQGTSQSLQVLGAMEDLTLTQLQLLRTPWGRAYLGFAQAYGPTIWGLT